MAENRMEYWFEEMHTSNVKMAIRVNQHLYSGTSEFRRIDVFDSPEFGKFLTSNGNVIFSEQEEFTYDEMVVHVPMAVHPDVKRVLVIGGGDGGVARELSHYKEIEVIDIAEPDKGDRGDRHRRAGQDVCGRLPEIFSGQRDRT